MEDEESSTDAIVISDDKDPLASDEEASSPAPAKPVTLTSFSLDFVEGDSLSAVPVRMTRKRSAQQSVTSLAVDTSGGKKLKLKVIATAFQTRFFINLLNHVLLTDYLSYSGQESNKENME